MPHNSPVGRLADSLGPVSASYSEPIGTDTVRGVWLGQPGLVQFEVCELVSESEPQIATIRAAWRKRRGQRGRPLIVFWQGPGEVLLTEPTGEPQVTVLTVSAGVALIVIKRALAAPRAEAVTAALSLLERAQGSGGIAGFRNRNLLSTHYLTTGFQRVHANRWTALSQAASSLRTEAGGKLLRSLGYTSLGTSSFEVVANGKVRLLALTLPDSTPLDRSIAGPGGAPATRLLVEARQRGAERAVLISGRLMRLYVADQALSLDDIATASTYIELDLDLLSEQYIGLLTLLFSAASHAVDGLVDTLFTESIRYALGLRARFSDRVYEHVVSGIAKALYDSRGTQNADGHLLYQATLRLLYRLLFVLYAEDRNLLPLGNTEYRRKSLTHTLFRLDAARRQGKQFDSRQTTTWDEMFEIFDAIGQGSHEWNVPAYNGGLFEPTLADFPEAAFLGAIRVPNSKLAPLLLDLAFDEEGAFRGKVDFGDLGVRHLGTLYEGLLSHNVRIAEEDLGLDSDGLFVPARSGSLTVVHSGDPYVISPKGGRKYSGSYYTPAFIVRRLIDTTLKPNLEQHLSNIASITPDEQWNAMLDYKIVDPAMGSGHFLVDALDTISDRFNTYLKDNPRISAQPIQQAREQITVIGKEFGIDGLGGSVGDFELLRRNVMRSCIYGVDQNPMAVELAKLSLWLHAFVPGLPLSYLGHNLRHGNALVGIVGHEIKQQLDGKLFGAKVTATLERALSQARKLAELNDLSLEDVKASESAQGALETETANVGGALNAFACRMFAVGAADAPRDTRERGRSALESGNGLDDVLTGSLAGVEKTHIHQAQQVALSLSAFHWQLAFPEVFLRERRGFDVILGNPPWDKVRFEEQQFWVSRAPGLNALSSDQRDVRIPELRRLRPDEAENEETERRQRETLQKYFAAAYKLQGRGHLDLSKLFVERVLSLKSNSGAIGYVLPGQALIIGGWSKIREALSDYELHVSEARNTANWLFADADGRLIVATVCVSLAANGGIASITPGLNSLKDLETSPQKPTVLLTKRDMESLSDAYIIPWLNTSDEVSVLNKMRSRPSLSSAAGWIAGQSESKWDFSGSGREHTLVGPTRSSAAWKVLMARHVGQYEIDTDVAFQRLIPQPQLLTGLGKNVVSVGTKVLLGPEHARIVYRYPARADDSRTLIAAYLPDFGFLPSTGYVHAVNTGAAPRIAVLALLGYMNSLACDWWTRRFVDRHVTAPVINALPLPNWTSADITSVSESVARLLARSGRLADDLETERAYTGDADRLFIEQMVVKGLNLELAELKTVLADFSDTEAVAPRAVLQALSGWNPGTTLTALV